MYDRADELERLAANLARTPLAEQRERAGKLPNDDHRPEKSREVRQGGLRRREGRGQRPRRRQVGALVAYRRISSSDNVIATFPRRNATELPPEQAFKRRWDY